MASPDLAAKPAPRPTLDPLGPLLTRSRLGDRAATATLFNELYPWLRRYYARRLPSAMIDDAVQEAVFAVFRYAPNYDPARPFSAWLATIAHHKWIDQLRTLGKSPMTSQTEGTIGDHGPQVRSRLALDALLALLKPPQSSAIRLVKLGGLSVAEAAAATGQSPALIKVNVHRGLARLRTMMEEVA